LLAGGAALLPAGGYGDSNTAVVNINQGNLGIQICGNSCVQVLQQYNIAVVFVSQGPDFAPALGAAYVSPASHDFGAVVHAKARDFALINTSSRQPLLVAAIGMSGANPDDFVASNDCAIILRPGEQCTIHVVFGPRAFGARSAVLAVRDSAPDSPQRVSLGGTGVAPTLTPDALQFDSVAIGTRSAAKTATLHNPGTDPLTVQSVGLDGPNASEFHTGSCGVVPAGGSCAMPMAFEPSDAGLRTATLTVRDDGLGGARQVALQGTGVPLRLSAAGFDFGAVIVGWRSQSQELVLENHGASTLVLNSIAFVTGSAADFAFTTSCGSLPATVQPAGRCAVDASFKPSALGPRSSSLAIHYTAGGVGFDAAAAAVGSGIQAGFSVSPASLDFGPVRIGQPATQTVTVTNSGTAPMHLAGVTLVGSNPGDFAQAGPCDALASDLAPGASCQLSVTFTPHAAGARGASLKFADNAPGTPHLLALAGIGAAAPAAPQAPAAHVQPPAAAPKVYSPPAPAPAAHVPAPPTSSAVIAAAVSSAVVRGGDGGDPSANRVARSRFTPEPLGTALPITRAAHLSAALGPCLVAFVPPFAGMVAWLVILCILFLIGFGVVARRWVRE
jgi:hypothetical protein